LFKAFLFLERVIVVVVAFGLGRSRFLESCAKVLVMVGFVADKVPNKDLSNIIFSL
jgi:hypothetical protein